MNLHIKTSLKDQTTKIAFDLKKEIDAVLTKHLDAALSLEQALCFEMDCLRQDVARFKKAAEALRQANVELEKRLYKYEPPVP